MRQRAIRAGHRLDLTSKEFLLLTLLARRPGEVLSRTLIAESVWDMNFDSDTKRCRCKCTPSTRQSGRSISIETDPHGSRRRLCLGIGPNSFAAFSRLWGSLSFRLTAWYALAAIVLVFLATASLYLVLTTELERSTDLFLADKLHVLRTMLRDRPDDLDALREEVELETAARRYEHFYIRLLDEQNRSLLTTPAWRIS